MLQELIVMDVAKLTRAAVEAVGEARQLAAGTWFPRQQNDVWSPWRRCGGSHRFWGPWCGAAVRVCQRSRPFPEVFDDCSHVRRRLSLRDRAITREMNESVFRCPPAW